MLYSRLDFLKAKSKWKGRKVFHLCPSQGQIETHQDGASPCYKKEAAPIALLSPPESFDRIRYPVTSSEEKLTFWDLVSRDRLGLRFGDTDCSATEYLDIYSPI